MWIVFLVAAIVLLCVGVLIAVVLIAPWNSGDDGNASSDGETKEATVNVSRDGVSSDDDDADDSSSDSSSSSTSNATVTDADYYASLVDAYDALDGYNQRIKTCATEYNNNFTQGTIDERSVYASTAQTLEDEIKTAWDDVVALQVGSSSAYYGNWSDICLLYECLWNRIDIINQAWAIDLTYSDPESHTTEINAPLAAANDESNKNIYLTKYESLYPTAKP